MKEILKSKNCFITGAAGVLGSQLAFKLAEKGCNLFITDRDNAVLESIRKKLLCINKDIAIFYEKGNLNSDEEISQIIKKCRRKLFC